jgi:hypothetical protein
MYKVIVLISGEQELLNLRDIYFDSCDAYNHVLWMIISIIGMKVMITKYRKLIKSCNHKQVAKKI